MSYIVTAGINNPNLSVIFKTSHTMPGPNRDRLLEIINNPIAGRRTIKGSVNSHEIFSNRLVDNISQDCVVGLDVGDGASAGACAGTWLLWVVKVVFDVRIVAVIAVVIAVIVMVIVAVIAVVIVVIVAVRV